MKVLLDIPSVPISFRENVRRWAEHGFNADFSEVRLYSSLAPLEWGCAAFTAGEEIYFAPGAYQPSTLAGRAVLAHELTHVLQQRQWQKRGELEQGVTLLFEPELEAESFEFGLRVACGERVTVPLHRPVAQTVMGSVIVQPVIINCGHHAFYIEFRKYNGWIVAKDVYLAFLDGGTRQAILELKSDAANAAKTELGIGENIYLQGHGSPGKVGYYPAHEVADFIAKFQFPSPWVGNIRAYCCSAGLGPSGYNAPPATDLSAELAATLTAKSGYNDSGAAELAAALTGKRNGKLICARVTGAAGVAINCCSYASGTRVLQNDQVAQKRVIDKIENTRGPVDDEWEKWVKKEIPPFIQKGATRLPSGVSQLSANALSTAACKASELSKSFYETLETSCQNDLIPSGKDLSTKWVLL